MHNSMHTEVAERLLRKARDKLVKQGYSKQDAFDLLDAVMCDPYARERLQDK
jgi:hypothetical protein